MPRAVPRGRPRALTDPLRFQILRVSFEISADDPAARRELRFLAQSAIQPEPARTTVSYEVRKCDGAYEISRNGAVEDVQFDSQGVLRMVYRRVQLDALAAWPDGALLRAVTGRWQGSRFIVVGESLWDRSRLALQLLSIGADVEGDDWAILHNGALMAYPRPLRVCGDDAPLPPLAPSRDELPFHGDSRQTGSWSLDLALAGIDWRITSGPVDQVVLLETNYGGQTRVSAVPHHEAARILMSRSHPLGQKLDAIRAVAQLASGARCYRLRLGSHEEIGDSWSAIWSDRLRARTDERRAYG